MHARWGVGDASFGGIIGPPHGGGDLVALEYDLMKQESSREGASFYRWREERARVSLALADSGVGQARSRFPVGECGDPRRAKEAAGRQWERPR